MTITPDLQALLLADHVHVDPATRKCTILGTFSALSAEQLPTQHGLETAAYIRMTGVHGSIQCVLRFVDLSNQEVLMSSPIITVSAASPTDVIEAVIPVPGFLMPHAGFFDFELAMKDGTPLGRLKIQIVERKT